MQRSGLGRVTILATALTMISIVAVDEPVARWLATRDVGAALWDRALDAIEIAIGIEPWKWIGVIVIVAAMLVTRFVPRFHAHASAWLLIASSHLLARNISFWAKTLTGRLRPTEWLARGGHTFFRDGGISFPSGHVVLVASLVVPIVIAYPRTRALLALVGVVMIARVVVGAHFVSDVIGGLALSAAVTWACAWVIDRLPAGGEGRQER